MGYFFENWTGGVASATSEATTVTMNAPQVVTANFIVNSTTSGVINFGSGFTPGGVVLNGSSSLSGTKLRLTDGGIFEKASAFYSSAVNVQAFTTDFSFQVTNPQADGFMFVLQNQGTNALGGYGIDLGYGYRSAGIEKSIGIKFDLYNNRGERLNSTGLYFNGDSPTAPAIDLTSSGVDLHSGHPFRVHMTYDENKLTVTITDTITAATATHTYTVNIPAVIGSSTAFPGFTAGTGSLSETDDIFAWTL